MSNLQNTSIILNYENKRETSEDQRSKKQVEEKMNEAESSQTQDITLERITENSIGDNGKNSSKAENINKQKEYIVEFNFNPPLKQQPTNVFFVQGQPYPNDDGMYAPPLNYDPATRNDFVKLVFTLVLFMLIITATFLVAVLTSPNMTMFFRTHGLMVILPAISIMIGLNYAMACSVCTRRPPCNYICLVLAVIGMSLIAAKITVHYKTQIILYATLSTTAVVFMCIVLAYSKFDFTSWMLYVVAFGTVFAIVALILLLTVVITGKPMKPAIIAILIIGTLLQVVMLIIELQTILGGKTVELSEEDYALGAYLLYTSIIDIFIKFVQILGMSNDY